ncbi:LamG domain-containing protein [Streptomyces sp. BH-SS-21]|uniref:LamG domain-containing protein n=1 Tax=Streptomyces liliiviolaceus TaxID=2823109 RepID=A0A940XTI9_9ACTN|nr:LamG domain-containing protein [Streptomyces liliiviolaceus]MBQ0847612.1 LamG domain-containing protein [Streptomyces liliiviolaceus]
MKPPVRHALVRRAIAVTLASSALALTPWTAAAAENRPPSQPAAADLMTGGAACAGAADPTYVRWEPTLSAVLRDPDGNRVSAQFEVSWTDDAGAPQVRTVETTAKVGGSSFSWTVPSDVPAFTAVSWRVRAHDGTVWGPWSSDGGGTSCAFVYDDVAPAKPSVSSPEYPDDDVWHDGVGRYGTFTVDSASDDTVSYLYSFQGEGTRTVKPAESGGPVVLTYLPQSVGLPTLTVKAVDRAGNASAPMDYMFRVSEGRTPVAAWKLADAAGATEAAAGAGGRPATAGDGVAFGAEGPARTAVTGAAGFDGTDGAYLTSGAPAADPAGAFTVSAWVRPDSLAEDLAAVSQDGGADAAAFGLGTDDGAWSFTVGGSVVRGGVPESGEWAQLTGVHDPVAGTARLYVNGRPVGTAENVTAPSASGNLQIGRSRGGAGGNWHGALADVRVWDRVVVAPEAAALAKRGTASKGYWALDEASGGSSPERDGGLPLTLGGDARVYRADDSCDPGADPDCASAPYPIVGEGHLVLDGDGDFAAADGPVVDTGDSFSLSAHVRIDGEAQDRPMTVVSLPGADGSLAAVRYSGASQQWQVTLTDSNGEKTTLTADDMWASPDYDHHLSLVYDDAADEILLYADGTVSARASYRPGWTAKTGIEVGRARSAGGWGEYLQGLVDEVHVHAGVLSQHQVTSLQLGLTDV